MSNSCNCISCNCTECSCTSGKSDNCPCPIEPTIHLLGGKYKAVILWHLINGKLRYSEIHRQMPKATDKMLTQQLRELEKDNLIIRKVYPVIPPKTEYSLTELGESLIPILNAMCSWGSKYLKKHSI